MRRLLLWAAMALFFACPASGQDLVLINANVLDVTDGSVLSGVSVVMVGGRIVSIARGASALLHGSRTISC